MPIPLDLTNKRFGKLVAQMFVIDAGQRKWLCLCDCGEHRVVATQNLSQGNQTSCGCSRRGSGNGRYSHGEGAKGKRTREYETWFSMLDRCRNPNNAGWKNYGGRGIRVCRRWHKFENFLTDMGRRPSPELSI